MWMKRLALGAYALVIVATLINCIAAVTAIQRYPQAPWWTLSGIAQTGFPMLAVMVCGFVLQFRTSFSWILAAALAAVGASLLFTAASHAFPEKELRWSIVHLISIALAFLLILPRLLRKTS